MFYFLVTSVRLRGNLLVRFSNDSVQVQLAATCESVWPKDLGFFERYIDFGSLSLKWWSILELLSCISSLEITDVPMRGIA